MKMTDYDRQCMQEALAAMDDPGWQEKVMEDAFLTPTQGAQAIVTLQRWVGMNVSLKEARKQWDEATDDLKLQTKLAINLLTDSGLINMKLQPEAAIKLMRKLMTHEIKLMRELMRRHKSRRQKWN